MWSWTRLSRKIQISPKPALSWHCHSRLGTRLLACWMYKAWKRTHFNRRTPRFYIHSLIKLRLHSKMHVRMKPHSDCWRKRKELQSPIYEKHGDCCRRAKGRSVIWFQITLLDRSRDL